MPLSASVRASLDRLKSFYNGTLPYDATTNPGGFRRGGSVINFDPALKDVAAVTAGVADLVGDIAAAGSSYTKIYQTLVDLNVDLSPADGAGAQVIGDTDLNNGLFRKNGASGTGSWTRLSTKTLLNAVSKVSLPADLGVLYPSGTPTGGDALVKMQAGTGVRIAFMGTSILYGQDQSATGTRPGINGNIITRSSTSIPEAFQAMLQFFGFAGGVTIDIRAYPGDSTAQMLTRWAGAPRADATFIEAGHNDANNYGGNGVVSLADYRVNLGLLIERELKQGTAVYIYESPTIRDRSADFKLRAYITAARQVAREYGVPFVETRSALRQIGGASWTDGVHLSVAAYNRIGARSAALFATRDEVPAQVGPGSLLNSGNVVGPGGAPFSFADARGGEFLQLSAGQTLAIPIFVTSPVIPVVTTYNSTTGTNRALRAYYENSLSGVPVIEMPNDGSGAVRRSYPLNKLERGYHTLILANQGSIEAFFESIRFDAPGQTIQAAIGQIGRSTLAGVKRPLNGVGNAWWGVVDQSRRLNKGHTISATMRLGPGNENGIALVADNDTSQPYLSNNQLMVLRVNTSLVIREFVNGAITNTTFANIFGGAEQQADIEVTNDGNNVTVYVDGVQAGQKGSPAFSSGFVAILSNGVPRTACLAMTLND